MTGIFYKGSCVQRPLPPVMHGGRASCCWRPMGSPAGLIALKVGCKPHVVSEWRKRYAALGMDAIKDRARCGRPAKITPAQKQRVVAKVCGAPPRHLSRWSVRTLAAEVKLPASVVHLILQEHDLHPHRLRTFNFSPDPRFEQKLLEVVGIYMRPPRNAVVICVDEKTGIQALDRTQRMLPLQAGKPRTWSNEYVRHGTRTMLAALQVKTGRVLAHVRDNRRSESFLEFMDALVDQHAGRRLCVVMDNLNTHLNEAAQQWLARHPKVSFHYTPTHASWVNLIECFFAILTKAGLATSRASLRQGTGALPRTVTSSSITSAAALLRGPKVPKNSNASSN